MSKLEVNKIDELEDLIELAEKISINIDNIRNQISNSYYKIILIIVFNVCIISFGVFYYEMQDYNFHDKYNEIAKVLLVFSILGLVLIIVRPIIILQSLSETIYKENVILEDLLNMIHSYKELVYKDLSIVKKAVVDMRLNRIKFSQLISRNSELNKEKKAVENKM